MASIVAQLYRFLWKGVDWLYPPFCGGCNKRGFRWCPDCEKKVIHISDVICICCGQEIPFAQLNNSSLCPQCQKQMPKYKMLRSWAVFEGPLRNAIHTLKYKRNISLGDTLSFPLKGIFDRMKCQVDFIISVPLSPKRLAERGYNQTDLLARPLAWNSGIPFRPHALRRVRETASQVGLNIKDRHQNVQNAFQADSNIIAGKNVLLVDDVATTGATLNACSAALLEQGAHDVFCLTLARAQFKT